jgi:hypothetical protein
MLFSNSGACFKNRHLSKTGVYKTGALPQIKRFLSEGTDGMPPLFLAADEMGLSTRF